MPGDLPNNQNHAGATLPKGTHPGDLFATMSAALGEGLVITDLESRIQFANPAFAALMGYAPEEMLGQRGYELFLPAEQWSDIIQKNRNRGTGSYEKYELNLRRKNGSRFWAAVTAAPYTNAAGNIIGTISLFADINHRKQMEANTNLALDILTAPFGKDFFGEVTRKLSESLGVDIAFISECMADPTLLRTIAWYEDGARRSDRVYTLTGTVCESIIGKSPTLYNRHVRKLFPDDQFLAAERIESFVGIPLMDSKNRPLGHIALMHHQPFPQRAVLMETLTIIGSRIASEIERNLREADLAEKNRKLEAEIHAREQADQRVAYLREEIGNTHDSDELMGDHPGFRQVLEKIKLVAQTPASVLIRGETGTGKELIARRIHQASRRADAPLIKVNCAALPKALIESELFGHERGAFTSAQSQRKGRFELADGGTLFLDEIGELSLEAQAKLLRVLQEREFERVGGSKTIQVDFRLIAATNRDLEAMVAEGRFRDDLYYRLNVFPIHVPPLRERSSDLPALAQLFLKKVARILGKTFTSIDPAWLQSLKTHAWPGNIRELENLIHRAAILSPGPILRMDQNAVAQTRETVTLDGAISAHILDVLNQVDWRIEGDGGAAAILGVNPSTLRSKIKKLDIKRR